jgi:cytochrome bd-type quinol oxidase subunit 1
MIELERSRFWSPQSLSQWMMACPRLPMMVMVCGWINREVMERRWVIMGLLPRPRCNLCCTRLWRMWHVSGKTGLLNQSIQKD